MIALTQIDLIRSGITLFKNFNWKIEDHEHWVIGGDMGSGKTLLLQLLAGEINASHGAIEYNFIRSTDWEERYWERKKLIKYVPAHAIDAFTRKGESLYYQQRYYATDNESIPLVRTVIGDDMINSAQYQLLMNHVNIEALLDLEITRLSNGQLKKLLIVKKLLKDAPKVLMLDYPFEGLDHKSRLDLKRFIDEIVTHYGVQLILVDHHHDLPSVINRELVLDKFKIGSRDVASRRHRVIEKEAKVESPVVPGKPIIEINNLAIQLGDKMLFNNFHWVVKEGERWALLGANGSGKTTLFSLIFADNPLAYGKEIFLFGRKRGTGESIWDIKKNINYIGPELISYINHKAIGETGYHYLLRLHQGHGHENLDDLVQVLDAQSFIHKPVKYFSSGELQLLLLMNGFLVERPLLLLDEPFQFLDPHHKHLVHRYLISHLRPEVTLILISHDEEDINTWSEKVKRI